MNRPDTTENEKKVDYKAVAAKIASKGTLDNKNLLKVG